MHKSLILIAFLMFFSIPTLASPINLLINMNTQAFNVTNNITYNVTNSSGSYNITAWYANYSNYSGRCYFLDNATQIGEFGGGGNTTAQMQFALSSNPFGWYNITNIPFFSKVNASSITCGGTQKFSAYDNNTGVFTCSADVSGGGGGANISTTTCSAGSQVTAVNNATGVVTCTANAYNTTTDIRTAQTTNTTTEVRAAQLFNTTINGASINAGTIANASLSSAFLINSGNVSGLSLAYNTSTQVQFAMSANPFNYYNATTFTDFYPKATNPLSYYNSTTFTNYYPLATNPNNYYNTTNIPYYSKSNSSSITCSGNDKLSAFNNNTGVFTCTADVSGAGGGANVSTTTCSGTTRVSAINNATGEITCSEQAYNTTTDVRNAQLYNTSINGQSINAGTISNTSLNASFKILAGNVTGLNLAYNTTNDVRNAQTTNTTTEVRIAQTVNTTNEILNVVNQSNIYVNSSNISKQTQYVNNATERSLFTDTSNATNDAFRNLGKANASSITCTGNDKISAYNNATGVFTCTADQIGGAGGTNYWQVDGTWMFPNTTAGGQNNINVSTINATTYNGNVYPMDTNPNSYYNATTLPQASPETDPLWSANYSALNDSWSTTYNATYDAGSNSSWNETRANSLYQGAAGNTTTQIRLAQTVNSSTEVQLVMSSNPFGWYNITNIPYFSKANVSTTTCAAGSQMTAFNNNTGVITCTANAYNTTAQVQAAQLYNTSINGNSINAGTISNTSLNATFKINAGNVSGLSLAYNTTADVKGVCFAGMTWNNITSGWDLNEAWTNSLGWGNISARSLDITWTGTLGAGNLTGTVSNARLDTNIFWVNKSNVVTVTSNFSVSQNLTNTTFNINTGGLVCTMFFNSTHQLRECNCKNDTMNWEQTITSGSVCGNV